MFVFAHAPRRIVVIKQAAPRVMLVQTRVVGRDSVLLFVSLLAIVRQVRTVLVASVLPEQSLFIVVMMRRSVLRVLFVETSPTKLELVKSSRVHANQAVTVFRGKPVRRGSVPSLLLLFIVARTPAVQQAKLARIKMV